VEELLLSDDEELGGVEGVVASVLVSELLDSSELDPVSPFDAPPLRWSVL